MFIDDRNVNYDVKLMWNPVNYQFWTRYSTPPKRAVGAIAGTALVCQYLESIHHKLDSSKMIPNSVIETIHSNVMSGR